jgi:hypothetical protein
MKRFLSLALALVMLAALIPAAIPTASAADPLPMKRMSGKLKYDGVISPQEWGEPDFVQEPAGANKPSKVEYWWRYNNTFFFFAIRVHTTGFKTGRHDAGGSYLVPRISHENNGKVNYLGLFSLEEDYSIFFDHLNNLDDTVAGIRVTDEYVEYEFATAIPTGELREEGVIVNINLDYHQPKDTVTALSKSLVIVNEVAEVAPPEETKAPETTPAETTAAELTDTAAPEIPEAPADAAGSFPAVPVIAAAAVAVIAVALTVVILQKKKKK